MSWYSYIYREVHTLAFAEVNESVDLKHNTEQKKHNISFQFATKKTKVYGTLERIT